MKEKLLLLMHWDKISFETIGENIITEKLRKTNIDELNDEELRYFVKDLLKYI